MDPCHDMSIGQERQYISVLITQGGSKKMTSSNNDDSKKAWKPEKFEKDGVLYSPISGYAAVRIKTLFRPDN